MPPERLVLVDGSNYIFRAFYALQQTRGGGRNVQLTTAAGLPTGALLVFSNMLVRLVLDERPAYAAVVFDAGTPTFRDAIDPEYKANRSEPPDDLKPQFPDRKSTRLNSSHITISYAVFCLKKKNT